MIANIIFSEITIQVYPISGGTLGLFTGMSILSMVEILHWLVKFIFKAFEGCSHMKKTNTVHAI